MLGTHNATELSPVEKVPTEVWELILKDLSDPKISTAIFNQQTYFAAQNVVAQRAQTRGWLQPGTYAGWSNQQIANQGFCSWRIWCQHITIIQKPYPQSLALGPRKKSFLSEQLLSAADVAELENYRRYDAAGNLDPTQMDSWLLTKLQASQDINDQYRYLAALMHFPVSQELRNYWYNILPTANKHKLIMATAGRMPPLLFMALLHANVDYFELITADLTAASLQLPQLEVLGFCLRAFGLSGNVDMLRCYLDTLENWELKTKVLQTNPLHIFKTLSNAATFGHDTLILELLQDLPETITTNKGDFAYAATILSSEKKVVSELAKRDTCAATWEALAQIIPIADRQRTFDFLGFALLQSLQADNLANAQILWKLAASRGVLLHILAYNLSKLLLDFSLKANFVMLEWLRTKTRNVSPQLCFAAEKEVVLPSRSNFNVFALLPETIENCSLRERKAVAKYWLKWVNQHGLLAEVFNTTTANYTQRCLFLQTGRDLEFITWLNTIMQAKLRPIENPRLDNFVDQWYQIRLMLLTEIKRLSQSPWCAAKAKLFNQAIETADKYMLKKDELGLHTLEDLLAIRISNEFNLYDCVRLATPLNLKSTLLFSRRRSVILDTQNLVPPPAIAAMETVSRRNNYTFNFR